MNIFHVLVLAVIEGITEFLPISSTGHLVLAGKLLGIPQTEFAKSFEISIQLGAILAVAYLYRHLLTAGRKIWLRISIAFIPTAIIGAAFYKLVKTVFLENDMIPVTALFIGGLMLYFFDRFHKQKNATVPLESLSLKKACIIGLCQSVSIIPGVSRAAATIIGGMLVGFDRKSAVEFSFLLAIPTMAAATALDLFKSGSSFSSGEYLLLGIGCGISFGVALFTVKVFLRFIKHNTFTPFALYRMVVAAAYWFFTQK